MRFLFHKYLLTFLIIFLALGISACMLPLEKEENENFFEKGVQREIITLDGEIYPFSVSISTRATHRLANIDGKLIAYLYSEIVDLESFENRIVEVDGYWQRENMQEVFYVEAIRLQNTSLEEVEEEPLPRRFETRRFTFTFPPDWEYSLAPDGVAHFLDKKDQNRTVFLMFSVEDLNREDFQKEPNISVSGMMGVREITSPSDHQERQVVDMFSNVYDKKYHFVFMGDEEEKQDFLQMMNSFVEGEEQVKNVIEREKRMLAEREASKLEAQALAQEQNPEDEKSEDLKKGEEETGDADFLEDSFPEDQGTGDVREIAQKYLLEKDLDEPSSETNVPSLTEEERQAILSREFTNLIDENAFLYRSDYYSLSLKVPFGYWFRNFGPQEGTIFSIGFADNEISQKKEVDFWLHGIASPAPEKEFQEFFENGNLVITFPRDHTSHFRWEGPVSFRDAMQSILLSIE